MSEAGSVGSQSFEDWLYAHLLLKFNNDELYSVQVLLTNIQRQMDSLKQAMGAGGNVAHAELPSTSIRMAISVMGILSVMIVYPFVQKYLVKGISIGAVKG